MTKQEKKCADLVHKKYQQTLEDYQSAYDWFNLNNCDDDILTDEQKAKHREGLEEYSDYEDFFDYVNQSGLCFDFVSVDTFEDQKRGYWRFQMSWGGPSDEFRIYTDLQNKIEYIEYWYMDWFDGASIRVNDDVIYDICDMFLSCSDEKSIEDHFKYDEENGEYEYAY